MSEELDVKGWMRVSPRGTIYGQIQGEKDKVDQMYENLFYLNLVKFNSYLCVQGNLVTHSRQSKFKNWRL